MTLENHSDAIATLNASLQGRYHVESELGEGGMATVYRATDVKHGRDVAIKVLKPELNAVVGSDRFLAEIKTTASLQHPHILPLFDSGDADGVLYYVMPYIEGESLQDRLDRETQLPVDDAVQIAREVADALGFAHQRGVIHRDIKPANILLQGGRAIVADFGIALALQQAGGSRLTETGMRIGTPEYMSPEQATGDAEVDGRSDVYSLGCVLFEMLSGEPPHTGTSFQQVLARVVMDQPRPLTDLRKAVPPNVEAAVATALAKLPADRLASASLFREALAREDFRGSGSVRVSSGGDRRAWRRLAPWSLVAALVVALVAQGWLRPRDAVPERPLTRLTIEPPAGVQLLPDEGFELSPDGRVLAFVARDVDGVVKLWVRPFDATESSPLKGTEGAEQPFWAPDGRDLGFFSGGRLQRIPVTGGAAQVLAEGPPIGLFKGAAWSPDGRIVYSPDYRSGLFEVPADGTGEARVLTELDTDDGEQSHRWPRFLPDGKSLLFLVQTDEYGAENDRSRIEVLDEDLQRHRVLTVNSSAQYAPDGRLLYWREGAIFAQELDERQWRVTGPPRLVTEGVGFNTSEWATFSISREGTLIYHVGAALPWRLEWRDRAGRLISTASAEGDYSYPELSADGRSVAYVESIATVKTLDLVRGTASRLTFETPDHYSPTWSPEGDWVAYSTDKPEGSGGNIYRRPASGGERELLYEGKPGEVITDVAWSPDGRSIAFTKQGDVFLLDLESRQPRLEVATPGYDAHASFSPNGEWLAYASDESERFEVYVVPVSGGGWKRQVSSGGGIFPQWSATGDELFFMDLDYGLQVASVEGGNTPEFGVPELLFQISSLGVGYRFDVAPDGRILVRTHADPNSARSFKLIAGWPQLVQGAGR